MKPTLHIKHLAKGEQAGPGWTEIAMAVPAAAEYPGYATSAIHNMMPVAGKSTAARIIDGLLMLGVFAIAVLCAVAIVLNFTHFHLD